MLQKVNELSKNLNPCEKHALESTLAASAEILKVDFLFCSSCNYNTFRFLGETRKLLRSYFDHQTINITLCKWFWQPLLLGTASSSSHWKLYETFSNRRLNGARISHNLRRKMIKSLMTLLPLAFNAKTFWMREPVFLFVLKKLSPALQHTFRVSSQFIHTLVTTHSTISFWWTILVWRKLWGWWVTIDWFYFYRPMVKNVETVW